MRRILARTLPPGALLAAYRERGAYTDCYTTELGGAFSQEAYVEAFYTTWLFKAERLVLRLLLGMGSTDADARALATGSLGKFAAWTVEARAGRQLLMCDYQGRTRSWLMSEPVDGGRATRLYFGSAVVPQKGARGGKIGQPFDLLLGFHRLYSRLLLVAARRRLAARKLR